MAVGGSKIKHNIYLFIKCVVLGIFLIAIIFPFYWITMTSFKPIKEIFSTPITYFPKILTLENYATLFSTMNFGRYIFNSVIISVVSAFVSLLFAVLGAYILARFNFRGKRVTLYYMFVTQMLPGFIGLAPMYQMLAAWNMIDFLPTLMILGTAGLIPYALITLRGFMANIPRSLEESAMIDGCNRLRALFMILLPVILPGLAAVYIFGFVQSWNNLFAPILYMNRSINYTIPVALNAMVMKNDVRWGELSAGSVIAILPTVLMFAFAQRHVASGLIAGALKE